jgi:hypothetical protein
MGISYVTEIPERIDASLVHLPYIIDERFEEKFKAFIDISDIVIILVSELHRDNVDFIRSNQAINVKYFVCGEIFSPETDYWMDWFITTTYNYKEKWTSILDQINTDLPKEKYFDVLLGMPRDHRDIVFDHILQHGHKDKVVMTYMTDLNNIEDGKDSDQWIWEPGMRTQGGITGTVQQIKYRGYQTSMSQVIPKTIYSRTAYSLVAETNAESDFVFMTEKIVKPILAKRLFLVVGGYRYLSTLKVMGFKTFDNVLDESYDEEPDMIKRTKMVMEQFDRLLSMDQREVQNMIKDTVDHNQWLMLRFDWEGQFLRKLRSLLLAQQD